MQWRHLGLSLLVLACACRSKGAVAPAPHRPAPPVAEDRARLTIPPRPETGAALSRLAARADRGEADAAWARAHYLLDLFDDARFRRSGASLPALGRAIAEPQLGRGAEATDRAIHALTLEVDRVLGLDRLHPGALAARTLLELDADPPEKRAEVFQRMVELKTVARGGGPVASNAMLRLFGYCRRAFEDAVRVAPRSRMRILAHCLYPLYDSDPEPYFADDPAGRPPPPRWQVLAEDARALIAGAGGRLAAAAEAARAQLDAFVKEHGGELPALPPPTSLSLPSAPRAVPYDWTPRLDLGDGSALEPAEAYAKALGPRVAADGRGALAVSLAAQAGAAALARAAAAARAAGASRLELMVTTDQKLVVPPGDYWSTRLAGERVVRLAVIPLSLAPIGTRAPAARDRPRASSWDPRHAALRLHLVVGQTSWRLLSPEGEVGTFSSSEKNADPGGALRDALAKVRRAFPDEDGLVLVASQGATYAALVAAASAARRDRDGGPLMPRLALGLSAPKPARSDLARRIERRWRASVRIEPASLSERRAVIRRCYLGLLDRRPKLAGRFRLELRDGEATVVAGPRQRQLRACVKGGIGAVMADTKTASAEVELSPR